MIGVDEVALVREIAVHPDKDMLEDLAVQIKRPADELAAAYRQCLSEAREQLIAERGDPTPHRLR